MKRSMLTILVLALGLMVFISKVGKAVPMGSAWTYQGRLMDDNEPADGKYDLQFKLFDAIGFVPLGTIDINEVDVIDGYFTVELDFGGDVFKGNARWLQIGVRPGDSNDSDTFVQLDPRQQLTPTPYASYAGSAGSVSVPLDLSGSSSTGIIKGTNTGTGYGVHGEASYIDGSGVYGYSLGDEGRGVYGTAAGDSGSGVYGVAKGDSGKAVFGQALATGDIYNFGGYFVADGDHGTGVHGRASATGNITNYGGYFSAYGDWGVGVSGRSMGIFGYGVKGTADGDFAYGVYGSSGGSSGRAVYGRAWGSKGHGVSGHATGGAGIGVYGEATNDANVTNYGGFFLARGGSSYGVYAHGSLYGVFGHVTNESGSGVFGHNSSISGHGVEGLSRGTAVYGKGIGGSSSRGVEGKNEFSGNSGMLGGINYGVRSEGDLVVTGAYRGDIGPNKGAPFPRPAYDSGWITGDGYTTCSHNIGGNVDNYVVDAQGKRSDGTIWGNPGYKEITLSSIKVYITAGEFSRIRIWIYN